MSDLQNKIITIISKGEQAGTYGPVMKIKDENNLTYSVYKTKQDGTVSAAWQSMPDINDVVQIGYVEEVKDHPEHGKVTYRTIRSFNKDVGEGHNNYQQQNPQPVKEKTMGNQETNWNRIGMIKGMNNLVGSRLASGTSPDEVLKEIPAYMEIVNAIEQTVDQSLIGNNNPVGQLEEPLPTIQVQDIDVSDIPF